MVFTDFIFDGRIGDLKVGDSIDNIEMKFEIISKEEGDIPSLFELIYIKKCFQVTTLRNKVIGMSFDFDYKIKRLYTVKFENISCDLGYNFSFNDFLFFIKKTNLKFEILNQDMENCIEILILKSNVHLKFINSNFSNLQKVYIFDLNLYNAIRKLI
ncbi:hypothetical protein [Flavobacterium polysaccharolyticum]|uniref:Immunity protein 50 n=1 Tax=Flavobacterium polysaccharolyticum TaxID=3133148 RepID=A0ABU9NTV3_9FLAO